MQKLQKNLKITSKNLQNVLSELAQYEVDKVKTAQPKPKFVFMLKKEATPEFNRLICKGLEGEGLFIFLTAEEPDKPKEGQIMIQGPEEHCNALGPQWVLKISELFSWHVFQSEQIRSKIFQKYSIIFIYEIVVIVI